uniref:hypothetical protein n=1 Tax=Rhodoferax sp. TaxID=50421 RepID=UPI00351D55EC
MKLIDLTTHMFLYPILGADSNEKSRNIWCANDKATVWQDWMVREHLPKVGS